MQSARRLAPLVVISAALLGVSLPGNAAAAKRITGKVTAPGYNVIAVAANGKVRSARAKPKFSLRPPAALVTLQLRTRDGVYGGPVVVGKAEKGKRAILGVRAGARLGKVKVNRRRGYAKARVGERWRDDTRWARAKRGIPIGADKFGFVKSKRTRGGAPGDRDLDGVANPLDVDANGNRVLDNLDRSAGGARAAQEGGTFFSHLFFGVQIDQSANVNAGSQDSQIEGEDGLLPTHGLLALAIAGDGAELDCGGVPDPNDPEGWIGGLPYCTRGGSGTVFGGALDGQPFPECCDDDDDDGQGTMVNNVNNPALGANMFLRPHATPDEIITGDVLVHEVHQRTGGPEPSDLVTTIQYAMATVPALVFYDDHEGHSPTVTYRDPNTPGPPLPGTMQNPFLVSADDTGQVKVTVTLWRPQRRPLPGEPGHSDPPSAWTDIGGLLYEVGVGGMGSLCPRDAFTDGDSNLIAPPSESAPGLLDTAGPQLANPGNTLRYTVNLTTCVDSPVITGPRGEEPAPPLSFEPGETRFFGFQAASLNSTNGASATQTIYFRREQ